MIRTARIMGVVSEREFTPREGGKMIAQRLLLNLPFINPNTGKEGFEEVLADRFVSPEVAQQIDQILGKDFETTFHFYVREWTNAQGERKLFQECKITKMASNV